MSRMYDIIQELCRRDGTDVTKMCRALKIPRSTLSELASGRTKQLTLKHARPIAEYFGVTLAQLAGDEPLETEPDQTDAVSDLIRDEPIAAYENLKRYLTEEDKAAVNRARRIQRFLSQPFHVAENFTGMAGKYVPLSETIRGFEAILGGECDDIPEQAFLFCGSIDDVLRKRDALK